MVQSTIWFVWKFLQNGENHKIFDQNQYEAGATEDAGPKSSHKV